MGPRRSRARWGVASRDRCGPHTARTRAVGAVGDRGGRSRPGRVHRWCRRRRTRGALPGCGARGDAVARGGFRTPGARSSSVRCSGDLVERVVAARGAGRTRGLLRPARPRRRSLPRSFARSPTTPIAPYSSPPVGGRPNGGPGRTWPSPRSGRSQTSVPVGPNGCGPLGGGSPLPAARPLVRRRRMGLPVAALRSSTRCGRVEPTSSRWSTPPEHPSRPTPRPTGGPCGPSAGSCTPGTSTRSWPYWAPRRIISPRPRWRGPHRATSGFTTTRRWASASEPTSRHSRSPVRRSSGRSRPPNSCVERRTVRVRSS